MPVPAVASVAEIDRRIRAMGAAKGKLRPVTTRHVNPATLRPQPAADIAEVEEQVEAVDQADGELPARREFVVVNGRRYRRRDCDGCGEPFDPTGPRHRFCGRCKPRPGRHSSAFAALVERVKVLEDLVDRLKGPA